MSWRRWKAVVLSVTATHTPPTQPATSSMLGEKSIYGSRSSMRGTAHNNVVAYTHSQLFFPCLNQMCYQKHSHEAAVISNGIQTMVSRSKFIVFGHYLPLTQPNHLLSVVHIQAQNWLCTVQAYTAVHVHVEQPDPFKPNS